MDRTVSQPQKYFFLEGGGEMGELIRLYDWSTTSLGAIDGWPVSLRTSLGIMLTSRFPMLIFWDDDLITFYNDAFRPSLGNDGKHPSSLGQPGEESWAESWHVIGPMIYDIMKGGDAVWFEDQKLPIYREGKMDYAYWTYSFSPIRDDYEQIAGLLVTCSETTKAVESREALAESKKQHELAIEAAELGTYDLNAATERFVANDRLKEWFGLAPGDEAELATAMNSILESDRERVLKAINKSFEPSSGGRYEIEYTLVHPLTGALKIIQAKGRAEFNEANEPARLSGTLRDITQQFLDNQKIQESETRFRYLISEAPFAIAVYTGTELIIDTANDAMTKLWGKTADVIGKPLIEALPEIEGQPFIPLLQDVLNTGVAYHTPEQSADLIVNEQLQKFWFTFTYKPLYDMNGSVSGILNMAADITEQVMARKKIEEAEAALLSAIELAELATWSIELPSRKVTYSMRLQEWLGVSDGLVQMEGSPNVIPEDRERIRLALEEAMSSNGKGRFDEIYTIINRKTSERKVIHANGKTVFADGGKALSISGTARDITLERERQLALEDEVQIRTQELAAAVEELRATNEELSQTNNLLSRSNEELAQYAYVASHDLQEPLRKIRIFSSRLSDYTGLAPDVKTSVEKIQNSADRMSLLINDLLDFSQLLKSDTLLRPVDLRQVIEGVKSDFELLLVEKAAVVNIGSLPIIEGVGLQMNQLFYNLIGNALKFSKEGMSPVISISSRIATGAEVNEHIDNIISGTEYHLITVEDNGIGFELKYAEQIFEVFKRLHGRAEYAGSGIGLALCRRIVNNHHGNLFAKSELDKGSTFFILLPLRQQVHQTTLPTDFTWNK